MLFTHGWVDIVTLCATICLARRVRRGRRGQAARHAGARDEGLVQFGVPERWSRALLGTLVAVELLLAVLLAFPNRHGPPAPGAR